MIFFTFLSSRLGKTNLAAIANTKASTKSKTIIIAEAGVNHNGDIELAKKLINIADESISIWNGSSVVNGTYFCKLSINNEIYWTKLMVIN